MLRPNNFFQNDEWLRQPLLEYGVYPQPIGNKGLHRVDVRDIADAVVNALLTGEHTNKAYNLVGPHLLTGESIAKTYTKYIGKNVVYAGDDLDRWAEQAGKMMPTWMVKDLVIMFRHFQNHGLVATPDHHLETERILGKKPRTFDAFVVETVGAWKQQAAVTATQKETT